MPNQKKPKKEPEGSIHRHKPNTKQQKPQTDRHTHTQTTTTTTKTTHTKKTKNLSKRERINLSSNIMTKTTGRVRIELYASKLKNVAGAFKGTSDPYAVVTLLPNNPNEIPQVVGRTEV